MTIRRALLTLGLAAAAASGAACTSFATVRSAEVRPGPSLTTQLSVAASPGPVAGWLWSWECVADCDHDIAALDLTFTYGQRKSGEPPYAFGLGLNGTFPFAEGYLQLRSVERFPFGVGGRVGIPLGPGWENQLYGRLDVPITSDVRLLWNPAVVHNSTSSPNGSNHGSFIGLVQGVGLELGTGSVTVTPSLALVWGRAEYRNPELHGPESRLFGTAALSVTAGRKVPRAAR
jgi:hypothetical protein